MGAIDKFLGIMKLDPDYEDNEIDEEDYLDDLDEPEEEDIKPKKSLRRARKEKEEDSYLAIEDEEEDKYKEKALKTTPSKVTPFRTGRKQVSSDMGVCVIKPTSVEDAREITETLLKGRTVVLNMEGINLDIAQRIIDFTSGSCFAISGNLQKISSFIFIITPPNVEISGDFANIISTYDGSLNADL